MSITREGITREGIIAEIVIKILGENKNFLTLEELSLNKNNGEFVYISNAMSNLNNYPKIKEHYEPIFLNALQKINELYPSDSNDSTTITLEMLEKFIKSIGVHNFVFGRKNNISDYDFALVHVIINAFLDKNEEQEEIENIRQDLREGEDISLNYTHQGLVNLFTKKIFKILFSVYVTKIIQDRFYQKNADLLQILYNKDENMKLYDIFDDEPEEKKLEYCLNLLVTRKLEGRKKQIKFLKIIKEDYKDIASQIYLKIKDLQGNGKVINFPIIEQLYNNNYQLITNGGMRRIRRKSKKKI